MGLQKGTEKIWEALRLCKSDFEVIQIKWYDKRNSEEEKIAQEWINNAPKQVTFIPIMTREELINLGNKITNWSGSEEELLELMNIFNKITFAASFLFACSVSHAATQIVQNGQSLQTALTSAASGDVILLQNGFYNEDCVVANKAITIKSLSANINLVQLRSITVNNAPAPSSFFHLRLSADFNATGSAVVTLQGCTVDGSVSVNQGGLTLRNCTVDGDVTVDDAADGDLKAVHTNVGGGMSVTKGGLTLLKCTVDVDVTVADALGAANRELEAIVLRSTIVERFVCKAKRSWTCYNLIRHALFEGEAEITGNDFDGRSLYGFGRDVNGTTTYARIHNNQVRNYKGHTSSEQVDKFIGIRITGGARADLVNNLIHDCSDYLASGTETNCGMGIFVQSTSGTKIIGNVIWWCWVAQNSIGCPVRAPFKDVLLKNNYLLMKKIMRN